MRRLAILGGLAAALVGCGGGPADEPWSGGPDGFEPDDTIFTAREQRTNARRVLHTFASDDIDPDEDWVRIRVTEPDLDLAVEGGPLHSFAAVPVSGSPRVEMWKEHGGLYVGPWTGGELPPLYMGTPGVYFLKFYEAYGVGGEYSSYYGMWKDSGGADVAVTTLVVPRELPAGEDTSVDVDVCVVNQGSDTASNVVVKLYVTSQRYVAGEFDLYSEDIGSIAAGTPVEVTFPDVDFSFEDTGPVYVVAKTDFSDGDLSNNFCVASTLHAVDSGDAWDLAGDDSIATARAPIVPGTPEEHKFFPAPDVDVVPLVIASGEDAYYEVWTSNIRGDVNTRIEILDDSGVPIASDANAAGNGMENGSSWLCKGLPEGSYFIWVDEVADLTGAYDLNVRKSELAGGPDALEFDDDLDTLDDVRPWHAIATPELDGASTECARSFHRSDDVDWVVYAVPGPNHNLDHEIITINPGAGVVPMYELYQADGDKIPVDGAATYSGTTISCALEGGLYYIRVVDAAGVVGTYKIQAKVTTPP